MKIDVDRQGASNLRYGFRLGFISPDGSYLNRLCGWGLRACSESMRQAWILE